MSNVFIDPEDGSVYNVHDIPDNDEYVPMEYYLLGKFVYKYIGDIDEKKTAPEGTIGRWNGEIYVKEFTTDELKSRFSGEHIRTREDYNAMIGWAGSDADSTAESYIVSDDNSMENNWGKLANTGNVYVPALEPTDDPMTRVIKLMVLDIKPKLNENRSSFNEDYDIDNLRSSLNGATKNTSITRFLMWSVVLQTTWEFSLINSPEATENLLPKPITISSNADAWVDIPHIADKRIFYVPLDEGEDPMKRIMKIAVWEKKVNTKEFNSKGATSHDFNNLRSNLKGKQKMSIKYMMKWCELLEITLIVKMTNPINGHWYKSVGFDIFTNVPNDGNAIYVKE